MLVFSQIKILQLNLICGVCRVEQKTTSSTLAIKEKVQNYFKVSSYSSNNCYE